MKNYGLKRLLLIIALIVVIALSASPAWAAPAFVQNFTICASGASISTLTCAVSPTAGNAVIISVTWGTSAITLSSCSATGYAFTVPAQKNDTTNSDGLGVCVATNVPGGAATVTVTLSGSTGAGGFAIYPSEYSGVANPTATDGTSTNNATGTSATSLAATTTTNGDLIYGAFADTNSSTSGFTAGTSFTRRFNDVAGGSTRPTSFMSEDLVQGSAGSIAATATAASNTDRWIGIMVTLKASGAGAPVVAPPRVL